MPRGFKALPWLRSHPDRGAAGCWWDVMCRLQECDSLRALRTQEERLWVISAKSSVQPAAAAFNFTVHPPTLTASITHYPPPPHPPASLPPSPCCAHLHPLSRIKTETHTTAGVYTHSSVHAGFRVIYDVRKEMKDDRSHVFEATFTHCVCVCVCVYLQCI